MAVAVNLRDPEFSCPAGKLGVLTDLAETPTRSAVHYPVLTGPSPGMPPGPSVRVSMHEELSVEPMAICVIEAAAATSASASSVPAPTSVEHEAFTGHAGRSPSRMGEGR